MLIYLRKFTQNDTKKQIEATQETYSSFFSGDVNNPNGIVFTITSKHDNNSESFKLSKAAGAAHSYRFASLDGGKSFAGFINNGLSSKYEADDILKITKNRGNYSLEVIKKDDPQYSVFINLFDVRQDIIFVKEDTDENNDKQKGGFNKIYYGAPGCGKSFLVNKYLDEKSVSKENRIKVTFHPEYANCDFVGQILPTIEEVYDEETGETKENVKYVFNPGNFTLALLQSYKTTNMVYLIMIQQY